MSNPNQSHPFEELAGQHIGNGNYVLQALHHKSHMSVVYRSIDSANGQPRAVKILLSERHLDRFRNEARLADELQHPNIVKTYHYQIQGEYLKSLNVRIHYMVMRWLTQDSLESIIAKDNARAYFLPRSGQSYTGGTDTTLDSRLGVAMLVLHNLSDAFDYLHQRVSIINRDVKPSNIQFHDGEPYLLDFGIAKTIRNESSTIVENEGGLTQANELPGTLRYMAPEQWTYRELSGQTDQYQLALTIYELLTGGHSPYDQFRHQAGMETGLGYTPVTGTRYEIRRRIWSEAHVRSMPTPLHEYAPGIPASVWEVLSKGMNKLPHERFNTMTEFAYAFFAALPPQLQNELPGNITTQRFTLAPSHVSGTGSGSPPYTGAGTNIGGGAIPESGGGRGYWLSILMLVIVLVLLIGAGSLLFLSGENNGDDRDNAGNNSGIFGVLSENESNETEIAADSTATPTFTASPTQTAIATATSIATDTPEPTTAAPPTETPTPTNTPSATLTPIPTATETLLPTATTTPTATHTQAPSPTPTSTITPIPTATAIGGGRGEIVFQAEDEAQLNLYIYDIASGSLQILLRDSFQNAGPSWSPDGSQVTFYSNRGGGSDIYTINRDGTNLQRLTSDRDVVQQSPQWSPDGNAIIFHYIDGDNTGLGLIDLNANRISTIIESERYNLQRPNWLSDTEIIYQSNQSGSYDFYIYNLNTRESRRLTSTDQQYVNPGISADGELVVFQRFAPDWQGGPTITLMNRDGEVFQEISQEADAFYAGPHISPDKDWVAYFSNQNGDFDIYLYEIETGDVIQLTSFESEGRMFLDWSH